MWTAWVVISLNQIYTNRYFAVKWRWNKIVHAILGAISMVLTIIGGLLAL